MKQMKIGMVGLDTSHAVIFSKLLNGKDSPLNQTGKVIKAFPGGSEKLHLSMSRLKRITEDVEKLGVKIVGSIEEAVMDCDAVLLESVDGGIHLDQLRRILPFKIPVFVDKPFALCVEDAIEMARLSEIQQTPIMSSSALRYAIEWQNVLAGGKKVNGADCYGPLDFQEEQPGYFWYGIHTVEMLYTIMGPGVKWVQTVTGPNHDIITASWKDGRIGTIRGNRVGNQQFGAAVHFENASEHAFILAGEIGYYTSLLENVLKFFQREDMGVPIEETIEIIRFIEAANRSKLDGRRVNLIEKQFYPPNCKSYYGFKE